MTRLIDADLYKEDMTNEYPEYYEDVLDAQPTIDAVPVIRCYECKYFTEFEKGFSSDWDGSCRYWNTHSTVYSNFCGCGARMGEEKEDVRNS